MYEVKESQVIMGVERQRQRLSMSEIVTALLQEFSAVTDYRTLRDSLPLYLANLLYSQCVLFYLRVGESLQLSAGSFGDEPGWSAALLAVAHINPMSISSDRPEVRAWRERCLIEQEQRMMIPLIYRQHCIGIMVILRKDADSQDQQEDGYWQEDEKKLLSAVAGVVALLLENTRLLEHDRERIHELALLNSISRQMNSAIYTVESIRRIVMQRAREIASVDFCECLIAPCFAEQSSESWMGRVLCEQVWQRFQQQHVLAPLILERPGDGRDLLTSGYLDLLPRNVQTFFAFPLLSSRNIGMDTGNAQGASLYGASSTISGGGQEHVLLGIVFGAYHRACKLRQVEITLLQVLTSQASAALENRQLVEEVIEARNEARKLLRQVLDNQRINEIILESIPSGLVTTDLQGRIHTFNYAAESLLDYHPYEVLGQSLHRFLDLRASFTALPYARSKDGTVPTQDILYTSTYTGEAQRGTVCILDRHQQELVLDVDIRPLCSDMGELIGMLVTFTDMTSMHRLEEEKRRLDRLALLGEMAAGVAHEVRNPLASIKTSMQMLRDDLEEHATGSQTDEQTDWAQQSVTVVLKEVERLDIIVRELLLFAKDRRLQRVRCNIAELSDYVLHLLHDQLEGAGIESHRVYEEVPVCWVDRGQLEQVLINLCTNALQAMSDGGILSIACRCITAESVRNETTELESIAVQRSADGAWLFYKSPRQQEAQTTVQWCELIVSDTGVGIAAEQIGHIFQPFYTTKAHGIGLGLAITRRLIEDHGGYIRIESHLGYGATFIIRFPLVTDALMQIQQHQEDTKVEE